MRLHQRQRTLADVRHLERIGHTSVGCFRHTTLLYAEGTADACVRLPGQQRTVHCRHEGMQKARREDTREDWQRADNMDRSAKLDGGQGHQQYAAELHGQATFLYDQGNGTR